MFKTKENLTITETLNNLHVSIKRHKYMSLFLERLPVQANIDKSVCNSGATSLALLNKDNVILLCPTISLVLNKFNQYLNGNLRVKHSLIKLHGKITLTEIKKNIDLHIANSWPIKIISTYDSFYKIESILNYYNFYIVIDLSHKLLQYAHMKALSKLANMSAIDFIYKTCYKYRDRLSLISASPAPVLYMPLWIGLLKQVKFEWLNTTSKKIYMLKHDNPLAYINRHIIQPMIEDGYFSFNDQIRIKKVILFINSVTQIKQIIKNNQIETKDVAILCGTQSIESIKPYKYLTDPTKLPKFTFITSTAFSGIDLLDLHALSIIVSTATKNYTMLNDALDLRQAISRQRLFKNIFFNTGLFIYNQTIFLKSHKLACALLINLKERILKAIDVVNNPTESQVLGMLLIKKALQLNTIYRVYTFIDLNGKYNLNLNVFLADVHFILLTRRRYEKGFLIKLNSLDVKYEKLIVMNIKQNYAPSYLEYASYYKLYIVHGDKWPSKFKNENFKAMIHYVYSKTKKVYLSLSKCIAQYKDNSPTVNYKDIQRFIITTTTKILCSSDEIKKLILKYKVAKNITNNVSIASVVKNCEKIVLKAIFDKELKKTRKIYIISEKN